MNMIDQFEIMKGNTTHLKIYIKTIEGANENHFTALSTLDSKCWSDLYPGPVYQDNVWQIIFFHLYGRKGQLFNSAELLIVW